MAGFVIFLILAGFVGLILAEKAMANTATSVDSRHSPGDATIIVERHFVAKLNTVTKSGYDRTFKPRLKKDAPTLHVEITAAGQGSTVGMHAVYTMEKRGILPFIPKHGVWIWRKQRAIAKSLNGA